MDIGSQSILCWTETKQLSQNATTVPNEPPNFFVPTALRTKKSKVTGKKLQTLVILMFNLRTLTIIQTHYVSYISHRLTR